MWFTCTSATSSLVWDTTLSLGSEVVKLISYLPKSNKRMKDDYLIVLGEWSDSLHCLTRAGDPSGVPLGLVPSEGDLVFLALLFFCHFIFSWRWFLLIWPWSPSRIFLQIRITFLRGSVTLTFRLSTTSWDRRYLWVRTDNYGQLF